MVAELLAECDRVSRMSGFSMATLFGDVMLKISRLIGGYSLLLPSAVDSDAARQKSSLSLMTSATVSRNAVI